MQSHRPIPSRHRSHLFGKLETFSTITLHGAGCFVSKAMARICISAKSIFSPVVEKLLMVAGASPALVSSLLIHGDQSVSFDVWLSVCPFHTRRAVVNSAFCCATQLPYQFRLRCALLRVHHHRSGLGLIPACNTLPVACVGSCVHVAHSTFYKHLRSFQGTVPGVMWSYPRASDGLQAVTNAAESSMFLHRALACPSTPPLL